MLRVLNGRLKSLPHRNMVWFLGLVIALAAGFTWHLGNLTQGMSGTELSYAHDSKDWSHISANPLNAPHKLVVMIIHSAAPAHPSLLRLSSVGFAIVFCLAYYLLAASWFGKIIGFLSTLLFASLPLLMIGARQATAAVMFLCPIVLMAAYAAFLRYEERRPVIWILTCSAAAVLIYTPGMLIWILGAFIICRRPILRAAFNIKSWQIGLGLIPLLGALTSLIAAAAMHHSLLREIFLIPSQPPGWLAAIKNTSWMFLSFILKTGHTDPLIIGRLPLLNILLIALLVFGIYAMQGVTRKKTICLGLSVLYAIIVAGINNNIELLALGLPAIAIFIAAGLRYLYIEWRSVFPRNPVPKTFALIIIAVVACTQLYFGLRYSLAAWPNTPATRSLYVLK